MPFANKVLLLFSFFFKRILTTVMYDEVLLGELHMPLKTLCIMF